EEPPGALLRHHRRRPPPARAGAGELDPPNGRGQPRPPLRLTLPTAPCVTRGWSAHVLVSPTRQHVQAALALARPRPRDGVSPRRARRRPRRARHERR